VKENAPEFQLVLLERSTYRERILLECPPVKHLGIILGVMTFCRTISPLAAQDRTTVGQPDDIAFDTGVVIDHVRSMPATVVSPASTPAGDQPTFAFGQVVGQPAPPPPTPQHTGIKAMLRDLVEDVKGLPSTENLFWTGIGGGLALATHPIDPTANAHLMGPVLNKFFKPGAIIGQSYVLIPAAATIYGIGRAIDDKRVSHMGSDLIQAEVISELIVESLKYTVRRERPDRASGYSFPSGHAADTMAFATALERHLDWRFFVPAYALASYVAMSRLNYNEHYVSDVMFGSAVGIIAGRTVTRPGHEPFPLQAAALPGGFAIMYVRRH
jgi:membrane-associated phospholipid phosphatase